MPNQFEQALLRYLSFKQLAKLQAIKVGIAGAGGLGSNCASMLVRSGIRRLKIVDFDVVDYSNLNRQFYFLAQVGQVKVAALKENLIAINPAAEIEVAVEKLEADNPAELFADCDVVIEALDRAEYKTLVAESCLASGKLFVAVSGLAGWGDSDRIKTRKIRDGFYLIGDLTSGAGPDCPPLAPCVAIAAAKQADVVLSYVLGSMKGSVRDGARGENK